MKFGIFYEHQLLRPWRQGDEQRLLEDALELRKRERLEPAIAAALARREPACNLDPGYEIKAAIKP